MSCSAPTETQAEGEGDATSSSEKAPTLSPEVEFGNVEYKRKLVDPTPERLEHLITQLKWRLGEGMGEAIYEVGVEDNGVPQGLGEEEMRKSLETLHQMATSLNADVTVLRERDGVEGKVAEVLIRRYAREDFLEIRIAVVGNVDSGKSTLLGVLTRGQLDNGRGLARMSIILLLLKMNSMTIPDIFRHKHEIETGRTSSISQEIMGFDSKGKIVNYSGVHAAMGDQEICEQSAKIITFIDLAGHEKYLRTTLFGLTGHAPDFAMLMVGANMGIVGMTKEHLGITLALRVPVYIVITKVDMCPENILKETLQSIKKLLKSPGSRKIPVVIRTEDDVVVAARNFVSERIAPIFCVSNVTGECLDLLRTFLNLLPARKEWEKLFEKPAQLDIDATWSVPGVGTVISGTVMSGTILINDTLLLGPDSLGEFQPVVIKSVQTKRMPVRMVRAGQTASLALKKIKRSAIRKGMVLISKSTNPVACREFEAEILVLYHQTTIQKNYEAVVHCGTAQQCAKILNIDKGIIRTGDKAKVRFRFASHPEYLVEGTRLIFREGRAKGIGRVVQIFPTTETEKAHVAAAAPPQRHAHGAHKHGAAHTTLHATSVHPPRAHKDGHKDGHKAGHKEAHKEGQKEVQKEVSKEGLGNKDGLKDTTTTTTQQDHSGAQKT